jgi:ADP-ribose pyrophosphatase YjhB (NUDIX family)
MTQAKLRRRSVAAVIRRDDGCFLAVRRPPDDDHLPDVWGLPAVTLRPGEEPEEGVRRVGREKLGVELEPVRPIGSKAADRGAYRLELTDFEARVGSGEPNVDAARTDATRYTAQKWADYDLLLPAAARGSLCCQILLDQAGTRY